MFNLGEAGVLQEETLLVSNGATDINIFSGYVDSNEMWRVELATVVDETTGYTKLSIGIDMRGQFQRVADFTSPGLNSVESHTFPFYIGEGQRVQARLNGTTSGDKCRLYLNGRKFRFKDR